MKKYPIFFFIALFILIASISTPELMYASLPKVSIIKAERKNANKTVSVSGKIQSEQEYTQTADSAFVISQVLVKSGDYVEKGTKLLKINYEKTELLHLQKGATFDGPLYVTSNFQGTVNNVLVTDNAVATENMPIVSVIDTDNLCAVLQIGEDVFSYIKEGQNCTITGSAFDDKVYKGTVSKIGAVASGNGISATVVNADVDIKNPDSDLKPGFNIKAKITVEKIKNAIIVPSECISQDDNGEFVYKFIENKCKKTYVKCTDITSEGTVIKSGIKENDYIITNPDSVTSDESYVSTEDE